MSRYKQEKRRRRNKVSLIIGSILLTAAIYVRIGILGYDVGAATAEQDARAFELQLEEGAAEINALLATRTGLEGALSEMRRSVADLEAAYAREVPTPATAALLELAQRRVEAGLTLERLEAALNAAGALRPCTEAGTPRRFRIAVGEALPANAGASFVNGLLRVIVQAPSQGADLTAARTLVQVAGGSPVELAGASHRHPVVIGNVEFLLDVQPAGLRGFVQASVSSC